MSSTFSLLQVDRAAVHVVYLLIANFESRADIVQTDCVHVFRSKFESALAVPGRCQNLKRLSAVTTASVLTSIDIVASSRTHVLTTEARPVKA